MAHKLSNEGRCLSDPVQATNGLAPSTPLAMLAYGCAWLRAASRLPTAGV